MRWATRPEACSQKPEANPSWLKRKIRAKLFIARCLLGIVGCLAAAIPLGHARQPTPVSEFYLKAKYIGTLADYVSWPEGSRVRDKSLPFVIAIYGESPFGSYPREIYKDAKVHGKPVKIIYPDRLSDLEDCDALFLCYSESDRWPLIQKTLMGKPILCIGDTPDLSQKGIMINFCFKNDRVSFQVSRKALQKHNLEIGSHVLKIAIVLD